MPPPRRVSVTAAQNCVKLQSGAGGSSRDEGRRGGAGSSAEAAAAAAADVDPSRAETLPATPCARERVPIGGRTALGRCTRPSDTTTEAPSKTLVERGRGCRRSMELESASTATIKGAALATAPAAAPPPVRGEASGAETCPPAVGGDAGVCSVQLHAPMDALEECVRICGAGAGCDEGSRGGRGANEDCVRKE